MIKKWKEMKSKFVGYDSSWSLQSVFSFRCLPQACGSHISLCAHTSDIRGRDHPRNSACWLIVARRNPQFTYPLPLVCWFSFLQLHTKIKKDLEKDEKGLVYISHRKRSQSVGPDPRGECGPSWVAVGVRGIEISWSSVFTVWGTAKGGCLHLLFNLSCAVASSLQQPWGAKCLEREQSSQELLWAATFSWRPKPRKSQLTK